MIFKGFLNQIVLINEMMFFLIVLTHHNFIEYEDKTWPFGPTNTEQLNAVGLTFTFAGGQRRPYLY